MGMRCRIGRRGIGILGILRVDGFFCLSVDGVVERPVGVVRVLVVGFRVVEVRIDLDRSTAWSRPGR